MYMNHNIIWARRASSMTCIWDLLTYFYSFGNLFEFTKQFLIGYKKGERESVGIEPFDKVGLVNLTN